VPPNVPARSRSSAPSPLIVTLPSSVNVPPTARLVIVRAAPELRETLAPTVRLEPLPSSVAPEFNVRLSIVASWLSVTVELLPIVTSE
jgi:hypothetical protein